MKVVRTRVQAGRASPAPPLGPALSQYGVPVDKVIAEINELTKNYEGMEVTVVIRIDETTGRYKIDTISPTTTSLLLKFAGAQEPSGDPARKKVGDISLEDVIRVALIRKHELNAKTLKTAAKSVVSTARTVGLTVNGKDPKQILAEIDTGLHDELFRKYESEWGM